MGDKGFEGSTLVWFYFQVFVSKIHTMIRSFFGFFSCEGDVQTGRRGANLIDGESRRVSVRDKSSRTQRGGLKKIH